MTVREVMDRGPVTVSPHANAREVDRMLAGLRVHHALVFDEGALVGVVCRCDLMRSEPGARVGERMSASPVSVRPEASVEEARQLMARHGVRCLPVMQGDALLGALCHWNLEAPAHP